MCWTEVSAFSFSSFLLSRLKEKTPTMSATLGTNTLALEKIETFYLLDARPGSTTGCGEEVGPLSSCRSAFPKAWLKEFWKLGTGTRSDPSLSPSLSAAGGASRVSAWHKAQYWLQEAFRELHISLENNRFYRKYTIIHKAPVISPTHLSVHATTGTSTEQSIKTEMYL